MLTTHTTHKIHVTVLLLYKIFASKLGHPQGTMNIQGKRIENSVIILSTIYCMWECDHLVCVHLGTATNTIYLWIHSQYTDLFQNRQL